MRLGHRSDPVPEGFERPAPRRAKLGAGVEFPDTELDSAHSSPELARGKERQVGIGRSYDQVHVPGRRQSTGTGGERIAHYTDAVQGVVIVEADQVAQLVSDDREQVHPPADGFARLGKLRIVPWRTVD